MAKPLFFKLMLIMYLKIKSFFVYICILTYSIELDIFVTISSYIAFNLKLKKFFLIFVVLSNFLLFQAHKL